MTTSSIPNSGDVGWIIAPAGRCVEFVAQQAKLVGILQRALIALASQKPLILAGRQFARRSSPASVPAFDKLLVEQESLGPLAQELIDCEYQPIFTSMLVSLWSAIEVATEDTVALVLLKDSEAVDRLEEAGVNLRKQMTSDPNEDTARHAVKVLKRRVRQNCSAGHGLTGLLDYLEIGVVVEPDVLDTLSELSALRNCFLHRGGIADSRLVEEAPGLELRIGSSVEVTTSMMEGHYYAVRRFAVQLIAAVTEYFARTEQENDDKI